MNKLLIPERIKTARENLGITKAEASRRLNLSKIGYCRYEYGERTPSVQTLEVIARCFNTSMGFLTGETDNMEPDFIVISKKDDGILFELVTALRSDPETINRIAAYYKSLTKEAD